MVNYINWYDVMVMEIDMSIMIWNVNNFVESKMYGFY